MKRLLLSVLGVLLVLASVMVARALSVHSREYRYSPAPALKVDKREVSLRLSGALKLKTIATREPDSYQAAQFTRMLDYLEQNFGRVASATEYERHPGSVVFRWVGREPELAPLLLLAHLDVVPVEHGTEEAWTWPPFSGEIAMGFIWGRGALDDKSNALAMLEAISLLVGEGFQPRRTVILAFGLDEEIGGEGGARLQAERFAQEGLAPALILDEGLAILDGLVPGVARPVAAIGIAEKGYATVKLRVQGEGGHASMPPRQTAVGILGAALAELEATPCEAGYDGVAAAFLSSLAGEMPFASKLLVSNDWISAPLLASQLSKAPETDALLRTTTAVTMSSGGVAENVLPEQAVASVNFRIHPRDSVADVLAHVERVVADERVSIELVEGAWEPSALSPLEDEAWWLLHRSILECFEEALVAPSLVLGATDARHYAGLSKNVYRFSPMRLAKQDLARLHGTDERISIPDYVAMIRFYMRLMRNS